MPKYIMKAEADPDVIKAQMQNPTDRAKVVRPMIEASGGKLEQIYFVLGEAASYTVFEMPDNQTMEAMLYAVYASGTLKSIKAMPVVTSEEAVAVFNKAAAISYQPPSA